MTTRVSCFDCCVLLSLSLPVFRTTCLSALPGYADLIVSCLSFVFRCHRCCQLRAVATARSVDVAAAIAINNTICMDKGDVFNRNLIITDIQTLTDLYADQGYAFVEVNPITSEFLDSVNISFEISLNKKTYLNRITISGNTISSAPFFIAVL